MSISDQYTGDEKEKEKAHELQSMQERIGCALEDPEIRQQVSEDFTYTFEQLGLPVDQSKELTQQILSTLVADKNLNVIEEEVLEVFQRTTVGESGNKKNLVDILHEKLASRAEIIFQQIEPHLAGEEGRIIDFGAGDGQVTQRLHDRLHLNVEGADVRLYPAEGVTVPIRKMEQSRIDEVPDGFYETAVLTNVMHHEKDNETIFKELDRIVTNKLVVIETVPVGPTPEAIVHDRERTFMNDYLYNRLFHNADVPVPGTYETPEGWIERFQQHGWVVKTSEDLGIDQPTIRDHHHLLVLKKVQLGEEPGVMEALEAVTEKDWVAFRDHLRGLRERVIEKLQQNPELRESYNEKQFALIAKIRNSGLDYYQYVSWHILAFGTPDRNDSPRLDLPGDLSVERLYQELLDR